MTVLLSDYVRAFAHWHAWPVTSNVEICVCVCVPGTLGRLKSYALYTLVMGLMSNIDEETLLV